jgi:hypothetical protein
VNEGLNLGDGDPSSLRTQSVGWANPTASCVVLSAIEAGCFHNKDILGAGLRAP